MKKRMLPLFFFSGLVCAQERTVATGGLASSASGSVSYTIGLIDYENHSSSGGSINQGIQQPYKLFSVGIIEWDLSWEMQVYPNPATSFINLTVKNPLDDLSYAILDLQGKLIQEGKLLESENKIDVQSLAIANYLLNIKVKNATVRTYQINKNN